MEAKKDFKEITQEIKKEILSLGRADFRFLVIVFGEQIKDCRLSFLISLTIA